MLAFDLLFYSGVFEQNIGAMELPKHRGFMYKTGPSRDKMPAMIYEV
jgi:hypothetical protein